jgi:hypothetical protein
MEPKKHDEVLSHAMEDIAVIATRFGINSRHLLIEFDVGRAPAHYDDHTVTIAIRDSDLSVTAESIPHHWLAVGTGFIDTRLSRRIGPLLIELENKAQAAGRSLD